MPTPALLDDASMLCLTENCLLHAYAAHPTQVAADYPLCHDKKNGIE